MTKTLDGLMVNEGKGYLYTAGFLFFVESHLKFLREHEQTFRIILDKGLIHKNQFNLTGLLSDMGYPVEYHHVIMRINDFTHPKELTLEIDSILIPSENIINFLKQKYNTSIGNI